MRHEAESAFADLMVDAMWQACAGQCSRRILNPASQPRGEKCERLFISHEQFDKHIAPELRELERIRYVGTELLLAEKAQLIQALTRLERAALTIAQVINNSRTKEGSTVAEWDAARQELDIARTQARALVAKDQLSEALIRSTDGRQ